METIEEKEKESEVLILEEEERKKAVREALAKFAFFLHLTAYLSGCSYLVILGILIRSTLPFVFIPIALWSIGLAFHFWKAFFASQKTHHRKSVFSRSKSEHQKK